MSKANALLCYEIPPLRIIKQYAWRSHIPPCKGSTRDDWQTWQPALEKAACLGNKGIWAGYPKRLMVMQSFPNRFFAWWWWLVSERTKECKSFYLHCIASSNCRPPSSMRYPSHVAFETLIWWFLFLRASSKPKMPTQSRKWLDS